MNRYLTIVNIWWQRALTYRGTVLTYRVADILETLVLIALWLRIFEDRPVVQGFTQNEMITYVLVGGLFYILTRNFAADDVARDIHEGRLSMFLTKPISYLTHFIVMLFGRSMHIVVGGATQLILIALFHQYIVSSITPLGLVLIALMLIGGYYTELLISFLIGLIAFWAEEVDGIYSSFAYVRRLLSGYYFPLALLPSALVQLTYLTPFAYRYFVPMQLFLGKLDIATGLRGLLIIAAWIVGLHLVIRFVWKHGLKKYESVGA